jgi:glycosyltransferase involved in cell wall biosynthesis
MITVCITSFNGQLYIGEQLSSILSQLGENDEVILSDDGSTDSTLDIVAGFKDDRIKVIHHDASTVVTGFYLDKPTHNFEFALKHASGDIIFLSDQDDVWLPGKVERMCAALEDADLAVHDCVVTDSKLQVLRPSYFEWRGIHRGVWRNFVRASYLGCCMAFRRTILDKALPFPETKVGHDLWLGIVADKFYRTVLVREPLVLYRKHDASKTTSGKRSSNSLLFKLGYRITILKYILTLYVK